MPFVEKKIDIEIDLERAFEKRYKLRKAISGSTFEVTIPKIVVEREAKKFGIPLDKVVEEFEVLWIFDGFPGLYCKIVRKKKD
jgi:hypothetical protein